MKSGRRLLDNASSVQTPALSAQAALSRGRKQTSKSKTSFRKSLRVEPSVNANPSTPQEGERGETAPAPEKISDIDSSSFLQNIYVTSF